MNPWETVRAATAPSHPGQRAVGAGGVRGRHPRRLAGRRRPRRRRGHAGARRARVLRGVGRARRARTPSRSPRPPTPCSGGPPIRGPGCPRCRGSAPTLPLPRLPSDGAPGCRHPWLSAGVRRPSGRATARTQLGVDAIPQDEPMPRRGASSSTARGRSDRAALRTWRRRSPPGCWCAPASRRSAGGSWRSSPSRCWRGC